MSIKETPKFRKGSVLHKKTDKDPVPNKVVLEVNETTGRYTVCSANDPNFKKGGATARYIQKSDITFQKAHEEYKSLKGLKK